MNQYIGFWAAKYCVVAYGSMMKIIVFVENCMDIWSAIFHSITPRKQFFIGKYFMNAS